MITYPEDSVLHRHIQSACQFTEVQVPDVPQDSVLRRHAENIQSTEILTQNVVNITKPASAQTQTSMPVEKPGGGIFSWLKNLFRS